MLHALADGSSVCIFSTGDSSNDGCCVMTEAVICDGTCSSNDGQAEEMQSKQQ